MDDHQQPLPFSRKGTSEGAAQSESAISNAASRRLRFLTLCHNRAQQGLCCWEAEEIFGLQNGQNGNHPRFRELELAGLVFVLDKKIVSKAITRENPHTKKQQQVYYAFSAVSIEQMLEYHGLKRRGGDLFET